MARGTFAALPGRRPRPAPGERSYAWLQGLLSGVAATLVPGPALLVGLLLAPGWLALLLDRAPGKPMARAVLLAGLAASVGPLGVQWHSGGGIAAAFGQLGEPTVLGLAWLAGAGGWLLSEIVPLFLKVAMDGTTSAHAARLKAERARLVEAWELGDDAGQAGAARAP